MANPIKLEHRSTHGEIRAEGDVGIIEGYAAVWNTVDSYNSSFQRGAFTKTLQERGNRVKLLWNHEDEVIGKPLELREDDRGLYVRAQLILSVPKAQECYELIKAGAIDTFSFGFMTVKDKWVNGVRTITEVKLMEVSPVIFEANSSAVITGVRNMPTIDEARSTQYQETFASYELSRRGDMILGSLYRTLDDIWYGNFQGDELRSKVTTALADFSAHYSLYTEDLITANARDLRGSAVQVEMRKFLSEAGQTPEGYAATTSFTAEEVRSLLMGKPAVDAKKLCELPEAVRNALDGERTAKVDALCSELRSGLAPAEVTRIRGLLPQEPLNLSPAAQLLDDFCASLKTV